MKIELDISAITVGEDEWLLLVIPSSNMPTPPEDQEWETDPLLEDLKEAGFGDRVFILYCDGVQMAKVKR